MHPSVGTLLSFVACCAIAASAYAQDDPDSSEADSLLSYDMQEIVVSTGTSAQAAARTSTVQRLSLATIEQVAAASAAQVVRYIPSAHVQTNSRGETLLYMRSAAERQTAIFFDGALLNIPWDNRLDIALIPAGVIGGMTVAKGAPAIEYGANVLGGAVNITSPVLSYEGQYTELSAQGGSPELVQANALHQGRIGRFNYSGSLGYVDQSGLALPEGADLPFNQRGGDLRTNTDRRITNAFARGLYAFEDGTRVGLTLLHIDAEQGVAPEGHLPTADARLWRYPEWQYTVGILSGRGRLSGTTRWKASAWVGDFDQTINAYESLDFDRVASMEYGDDRTYGTRLTLAQELSIGTVRLSANGLVSTHEEQEVDLEAGSPVEDVVFPTFTYRQELGSVGATYEVPLTDRLEGSLSGSYDVMRMPETGDKPGRDPFTDYSLSAGAHFQANEAWFVRGALGRKTRFPTMRELFGEALNRFLVNPDLRPESALLAEVGVGVDRGTFQLEVIPFVNYTTDTIDRRNVTVDGDRKRQRINLEGSRVLGLEVTGDVRLASALTLGGYVTVMDIRRRQDAPDDPTRLAEKPEVLSLLSLRYTSPFGLSGLVETSYTGTAYSLDEDNRFVELDPALVLNARVGYLLHLPSRNVAGELFVRGDNLTDAVVVSQLGLPGAGRTLRVGMELSLL